MARFSLKIKCSWSKDSGYKSYVADEVSTDSGNAGDEEDVDMSDDE